MSTGDLRLVGSRREGRLMNFASAERATPEPPTFEELVWACPNCGWTSALCTEHRAMAEEIRAEQDADARREAGEES